MTEIVAGSHEVREEDAFDVEAVRDWLAAQGYPLTGDVVVRQFGGGASNLTYSLRTEIDDLILRRPPAGQFERRGLTTLMIRSSWSGWG